MGVVRQIVSSGRIVLEKAGALIGIGVPRLTKEEQIKSIDIAKQKAEKAIETMKEAGTYEAYISPPPLRGGGGGRRTPSVVTTGVVDYQEQIPEIQKVKIPTRQDLITARAGGKVQVGGRSYTGGAYIPERGMTANEYQRTIRAQLVKEGKITQKEAYKYTISEELPTKKVTKEYIPAEQRESKLQKDYEYPTTEISTKKMETYSKDWNAFVTPSISGGTATFTQPTLGELRTIQEQDKLNKVTSFIFGGEKASDSLLLSRTSDLQKRYVQGERTNIKINTLSNELDKLAEGKVTDNTWTGTDEEYQAYQNKFNQYNRELERQKTYGDSVKVGAFGLFLDRPISEIKGLKKPEKIRDLFVSAFAPIAETTGGILGGLGKKLPDKKLTLVEEQKQGGFREVTIFGGTQAGTKRREWFGEERIKPKVETPFTLSQAGENVGQMVGYYGLPYVGLGLYASERADYYSEKGGIWKGVKESPIQAALDIALLAIPVYKGAKWTVTPRERLIIEQLEKKIPSAGQISMSQAEVIAITDKGVITSRQFIGKGIAEDITIGQRRYFSTPLQDLFKLKPTYSGKYTGDVLKVDYKFGQGQKTLKISAKESKLGYQKVKEMLIKRGFTEQQATQYMQRISAKRTGYATSFGGEIIVGERTPLISISGERLSRGLKEKILLKPTKRITIESPTRIGKVKQEEVSSLLEEFKTKIPKGKEEGDLGTVSFFRGSSEEFNAAQKIGKKTTQFQEGAIAKKTGEETFDLGTIETYKTGQVSKETTYLKPKKISGSQADIIVINPEIQKITEFDLVTGIKTIKIKPIVKTDVGIVRAEEWIKISEENLPIKLIGESNVIKPAKITKTPFSKTFGETKTTQVMEYPKVTEQQMKQVASDISSILKQSKVKTVQAPRELIESQFPRMVGGTQVIEKGLVGTSIGFEETSIITRPEVKMNVLSGVREETKLRDNLGVSQVDILKTNTKFDMGMKTKPETRVREEFKVNELLKMKEETIQKFVPRFTEKIVEPRPKPPKPKPLIPIKPVKFNLEGIKSKQKAERLYEAFQVFGRRYGKDILLKKVQSEQQAKEELKKFLTGTLGAGGFVEKYGKRVKIDLGKGFRPSKIETERVIQEKGFRLGTGGERREIISARKKSKRLKWF